MRLGVIADGMTARCNFLCQRGECADVSANQEESGVRIVALEQVEQGRSDARIWPVIERKRESFGIAHSPGRLPE